MSLASVPGKGRELSGVSRGENKIEKSKLWGSPAVVGFLCAGDLDQVEAGVRNGGALPSSFYFSLAPEERQARKKENSCNFMCSPQNKNKNKNKKT